MDSSRRGYEYRHRFCTDGDIVSDDILSIFNYDHIKTLFLFELRTNFILKRIDVEDEEEIIASERLVICHVHFMKWWILKTYLGDRLEEYWMPDDEIENLLVGAANFADERAAVPGRRRDIPVAVAVDVLTVQQDGELLSAAVSRAIRPEFMYPLELWPRPPVAVTQRQDVCRPLKSFLWSLKKIRVTDVEEGLRVMEECNICLNSPTIGDRISLIPNCGHAFHNHCLVKWLTWAETCPVCRCEAHPYRPTNPHYMFGP
ncbi:hypothetical protein ABFX02_13G124100 [Erythranthe guttata]